MAAFESWVVGNPFPDPKSKLVTTAVLNIYIETLTAAKNTVEITSVRAAFELAITILTLVRVRVPVLFPFLHPFISDMTRTRR